MSITKNVIKHSIWLLLMVVATTVLVAVVANNGQALFAATVTFALMVPLIGSAAVDLKRDWLEYRIQNGQWN